MEKKAFVPWVCISLQGRTGWHLTSGNKLRVVVGRTMCAIASQLLTSARHGGRDRVRYQSILAATFTVWTNGALKRLNECGKMSIAARRSVSNMYALGHACGRLRFSKWYCCHRSEKAQQFSRYAELVTSVHEPFPPTRRARRSTQILARVMTLATVLQRASPLNIGVGL